MKSASPLHHLSDKEVIAEVGRLAHAERAATARLIECLDEFDQRRLFLNEGFSSLFAYCTQYLHLCEYSAYARIEVARASRRFPEILCRLRDGRLTLTNAGLLAPHLTEQNHLALLDEAENKRKDDVKVIVARLKPKPAALTVIRRAPVAEVRAGAEVPAGTSAESKPLDRPDHVNLLAAQPTPSVLVPSTARPVVTPLSPELYKVQLTINRETREKLREVQDLLRHSIPNGDAAVIFERAISLLLEDLRRRKLGLTKHPRLTSTRDAEPLASDSRVIPAHVKRAVVLRDQGRCAFVGAQGRCEERGFLEFHHVVPFAAGGKATVDNIALRCRAHNGHEAVLYFGEEAMPRRAQ